MGELGLNKILGAILATCLGLFALHEISGIVFSHGGGHHGDDHAEEQTATERFCSKFAYCIDIADTSGGAPVEEVFDLGFALASADASKGERTFKAQCTTCHTIDSGGANGTGPNLHNIVGAATAHNADFGYSAAIAELNQTWTYEELDHWLNNPSSYARGTSMSFAGLRRDNDRMNVIAYLAANTENAPAFPDPLPAAGEEAPAESDTEGENAAPAEDAAIVPTATEAVEAEIETDAVVPTPAPVETPTLQDVVTDAAATVGDNIEDAADTVVETVTDAVTPDAPVEETPAEIIEE